MKILISHTSDGTHGGLESSAVNLAHCLTETGHEVVLQTNLAEIQTMATQYNFKIIHGFIASSLLHSPLIKLVSPPYLFIRSVIRVLLIRPDIINPHSRHDQIYYTLTKPIHGKPVVWKDAGDLVHHILLEPRRGMLARLNQWLHVKALSWADGVYTLNQDDKKEIIYRLRRLGYKYNPNNLSVIPSDIMFDDYNLDANPPKKTDKLIVSYVGRLHELKSVDTLINTFKRLSQKNIELWLVGEGPERKHLEKLAAGANVVFWGFKSDISPFLARTDVFVQPATTEAWGRNIKEAMYFGKPIIGSNTGGIALQIEDRTTGLLFEPGSESDLLEKLEELVNSEALREYLGTNAQKKALATGDYNNLVSNRILPLFESKLIGYKSQ